MNCTWRLTSWYLFFSLLRKLLHLLLPGRSWSRLLTILSHSDVSLFLDGVSYACWYTWKTTWISVPRNKLRWFKTYIAQYLKVRDFRSDTGISLTTRIASITETWIPWGRVAVGGIGENNSKWFWKRDFWFALLLSSSLQMDHGLLVIGHYMILRKSRLLLSNIDKTSANDWLSSSGIERFFLRIASFKHIYCLFFFIGP